jgi:hypothetical protein
VRPTRSLPLAPLLLGAAALAALTPLRARADALPPPLPLQCPAGSHVVHDHGGTHCVQDAPNDCPVGWVGRAGGRCVLRVCTADAVCGADKCRGADLCAFDDPEHMRYGSSDPSLRGPLLGAPPFASKARLFSGPCGAGKKCGGGERCMPAKVCLPPSVAAPAPRPKNAEAAVTFGDANGEISDFKPSSRDSEGDGVVAPPESAAPPAVSAAPPPSDTTRRPGKAGGCAGCTASPRTDRGAWAALLLGAGLVVAVRRRAC